MIEAYGASNVGCVRTNNEDYFLVAPTLGQYVVADGMGGAQAGEHASKLAVETVHDLLQKDLDPAHRDSDAVSDALVSAFEEANRRVMDAAASDPGLEGMGTTLIAAMESDDGLDHRQRRRQPRLRFRERQTEAHHRGSDLGQRSRPPPGNRRGEPQDPSHAPRPHHGHRRLRTVARPHLRASPIARHAGSSMQRRPARRGAGRRGGRDSPLQRFARIQMRSTHRRRPRPRRPRQCHRSSFASFVRYSPQLSSLL